MKYLLIILTLFFSISSFCDSNEIDNIKQMKIAAMNGDSFKQVILGVIYRDGDIVSKNINESIKWFEMAAKNNNETAILSLGTIYAKGKDLPQDSSKAIYYYKLVADKNGKYQPTAQLFLADYYERLGDKENALMWYKKLNENKLSMDFYIKESIKGINRLAH